MYIKHLSSKRIALLLWFFIKLLKSLEARKPKSLNIRIVKKPEQDSQKA
jgi:hypothetical protein